jgi:hypothetical protein
MGRPLDAFRMIMSEVPASATPESIGYLLDMCVTQACRQLGLAEADIRSGGPIVTMFLTPKDAWEAVVVGPDAYQLYPGFLRDDGETIVWPNVWVADNYSLEKFVDMLEQELANAAAPAS